MFFVFPDQLVSMGREGHALRSRLYRPGGSRLRAAAPPPDALAPPAARALRGSDAGAGGPARPHS